MYALLDGQTIARAYVDCSQTAHARTAILGPVSQFAGLLPLWLTSETTLDSPVFPVVCVLR